MKIKKRFFDSINARIVYPCKEKYFEYTMYGKQISKYRDKYKGKRCFVVGNGPSLNEQDLSLLAEEYVFTVNELMRHERFSLLKSNFHILPLANYLTFHQPLHFPV